MALTSQQLHKIKKVLLVIFGSFILGIGTGVFLVPYDIISGGVPGIAIIINYFTNFNQDLLVTIITWAFFFLGWLLLGTKFAIKTVISAIVYPLAFALGTWIYNSGWLNIITSMNIDVNGTIQSVPTVGCLITALIGGVFVGGGCALTYLGGGSTGGVDVVTLAVQKYFGVKASIPYFLIDATIIFLGFIFVNALDVTLIGIMSSLCASFMVNKIFDSEKSVVVNVISKKYAEINNFILKELDRGSTLIDATGGYSEQDIKILQVVLGIREYYILEDIIARVDPKAFVVVNRCSAVRGEGFKSHAKPKIKLLKKKNKDERL